MNDLSNELHAIAARLQLRIGEALESDARRKAGASTTKGGDGLLWRLIRSDSEMPDMEVLDVLGAFHQLDLADLLDRQGLLERLPTVFGRSRDVIGRLFDARSPEAILAVGGDLGTELVRPALAGVARLVGGNLGIVLSFVTTLRNLGDKRAPEAVRQAYLQYFFGSGYETVDGTRIASPIQLGSFDLPHLADVRGALTPRTGDRYVRDLVRLLVEAVDDVRYDGLGERVATARAKAGDRHDKLMRWLRGVSGVAESQAMSAVEQATLGVATFQSNPLIAAAAGTFAGTAARKAAQHVFLSELGV
jgi:hypothetical protein